MSVDGRPDDSVTVRWGLSSEDEMCIAVGMYYPSLAFERLARFLV